MLEIAIISRVQIYAVSRWSYKLKGPAMTYKKTLNIDILELIQKVLRTNLYSKMYIFG